MHTRIVFRNAATLEVALPPLEVITQLLVALSKGQGALGFATLGSPTEVACLVCVPDIVCIGSFTAPVGNKARKEVK